MPNPEVPDQPAPETPRRSGGGLGRIAGIGFELAAAVAGFTAAGYWADHHYGTGYRWTLVGAVLGMVGGMYNLIRSALLESKRSGGEDRKNTNGDKNR